MRRIIGSIIKSNKIFGLIRNKDRIIVGLSGGKDSTILFLALNLYAKKMKLEHKWDLKIYGYHVNPNFVKSNYKPLIKWAKDNELEFNIIDSNIAEVLNKHKKNNKVICSLCAKMRKAILVKKAKELKCNKIALAHHIDDCIVTFFLNYVNEGRMATISPKMYLDRNKITLIRPLILSDEADILAVAKKLHIPIIKNMCPNESSTQRTHIKNLLSKDFYDNKIFLDARLNFKIGLINGKQANLWFVKDNKKNLDLLKEFKQNN